MIEIISVAILLILLLISSNGLILYYLYNLEGETCNCELDWRHNYIKYSSFILGVSLLLTLLFMYNFKSIEYYHLCMFIFIILLIIVNGFIFYDYIKYLETSKCNCAIDKQKKLHAFMNDYSFVSKIISIYLTTVILFLISAIINVLLLKKISS